METHDDFETTPRKVCLSQFIVNLCQRFVKGLSKHAKEKVVKAPHDFVVATVTICHHPAQEKHQNSTDSTDSTLEALALEKKS